MAPKVHMMQTTLVLKDNFENWENGASYNMWEKYPGQRLHLK